MAVAKRDERDFLDELIDLQNDWQAFSNPLGDIADSLMQDPSKKKTWNPADYKEVPVANSARCVCVSTQDHTICTRCMDICPTDSIRIDKKAIKIDDSCRKCGLCAAICPTDALFVRSRMPKNLYETVARKASAYKRCYITCTRALGRLPYGNEVVLACVGLIPRDVWFAILTDYNNVSVYLPMGICDRCRTTTGEEMLSEEIATAEQWADASVGLEIDEADLDHEYTRAYKRSQFVSSALQAGDRLMTGVNPALAGAKAIAAKIQDHTNRMNELTASLENAVGARTATNKQRQLTARRKLMLEALQRDSGLAERIIGLEVPVCDSTRCTMCGDCALACSTHALDLDKHGNVQIEIPYCMNCGFCADVCPEDALTMVPLDAAELVIPDPYAEEIAKKKAEAKAEAERLIAQGKERLNKMGDMLESLDKDS